MLGSPPASSSRGFRKAREHRRGGGCVCVRSQDTSPATLLLPAITSYQCLLTLGAIVLQPDSSLLRLRTEGEESCNHETEMSTPSRVESYQWKWVVVLPLVVP